MQIDYRKEFQRLLDFHGIEHFDAMEVLYMGLSHNDPSSEAFELNELPPLYLWPEIVATIKVADGLRKRLGSPVFILSAYRSEAYNEAINGSANSRHLYFNALDLRSNAVAPAEMMRVLQSMRDEGLFIGGLGLYSWGVHVDTRGENATWSQ